VGRAQGGSSQLAGSMARLALVWRLLGVLAAAFWGAVFVAVGGFHIV
jgi:hypothetical protein